MNANDAEAIIVDADSLSKLTIDQEKFKPSEWMRNVNSGQICTQRTVIEKPRSIPKSS
jgi:hypothetical protein